MSKKPSRAGGFIILVGILVGAIVGNQWAAAVPGAIAGLATGAMIATLMWFRDRK